MDQAVGKSLFPIPHSDPIEVINFLGKNYNTAGPFRLNVILVQQILKFENFQKGRLLPRP